MDYKTRFYKSGDETGIVNLLVSVLDGWPKFDIPCEPIEHWRWKYSNSLGDQSITVAESDGKIIGCLHTISTYIKLGEKIVKGNQGSDLVVHPDFRGKGVYNGMNDLYENLVLSYSLSSNPIVYNKAVRLGCTPFPKPISKMVRIIDIKKHLKEKEGEQGFVKEYGFKTLNIFQKILRKIRREKTSIKNELEVKKVKRFDERINYFWNEIKDLYDFIIVRDSKYLNWRFCDPRGGEHNIFLFEKNGEIIGYSVLRINRYEENYPVGNVVDLVCLPRDESIQIEIFKHAVEFFEDRDINCILFLAVGNSSQIEDAKKFNFITAPKDFRMWFPKRNIVKTNFLKQASLDRLFFSLGDTDWI